MRHIGRKAVVAVQLLILAWIVISLGWSAAKHLSQYTAPPPGTPPFPPHETQERSTCSTIQDAPEALGNHIINRLVTHHDL